MVIESLSITKDYWLNFNVTTKDLEFLYNYMLETERPQTSQELVHALVGERIRIEENRLKKQQQSAGAIYYPKDHYHVGQNIQIPGPKWETVKVISTRAGNNPELPSFEVIEVETETGERKKFVSGLANHKLNQPVEIRSDTPLLNVDYVIENFGEDLTAILTDKIEDTPGLVRIAGMWFPRALLIDIHIGHLNLAEAILDMMGGGPLSTKALIDQLDFPTDIDANLWEFSLNLALQEDPRFDEVGPVGEILWYLHRLEPESVQEVPTYLRYSGSPERDDLVIEMLAQFEPQILDELEPSLNAIKPGETLPSTAVALPYPHWRAGTLPLSGSLSALFPTALESPRIQFTFTDGNSGEKFSGWVIQSEKYVYGLRDWYSSQGIIPGGLVYLQPGPTPGEVSIRVQKKRGAREWIRTVVIGSDGGIIFSMLKHNISAAIDERMALMVPDVEALDKIWERNIKQRQSLINTVQYVMKELAKLSPQSHVHAQELYAGVNVLQRCPPGAMLSILNYGGFAQHLGNLYFRLVSP